MVSSRICSLGCQARPATSTAHYPPLPHSHYPSCSPHPSPFTPASHSCHARSTRASATSSPSPSSSDNLGQAGVGSAGGVLGAQSNVEQSNMQQSKMQQNFVVDPDTAPTVVLREAWERLQEVNAQLQAAVAQEDYRQAAVLKREAEDLLQQMSPVQLYLMEQVDVLVAGMHQQKMEAIQALWDCSLTTMIPVYLQDRAVEAAVAMFGEASPIPEVENLVRQFCQLLFQSNEDEVAAFGVFKKLAELDPDKAMLMASILRARARVNGKRSANPDGSSGSSMSSSSKPSADLNSPGASMSGVIIQRKGPDSTSSPENVAGALPPELQKVLDEEGISMEMFDDEGLWQALLSDSEKMDKMTDKAQARKGPTSGKARKRTRAIRSKAASAAVPPPLRRPERPGTSRGRRKGGGNNSEEDSSSSSNGSPEMDDEEMVYMCAMLISGGRDDKARGIAKLWNYCSGRRVSFEFQVLALAAVRAAFKSPASPAEQLVIDTLCLNVFAHGADPNDVLNLYIKLPIGQVNLDNSVLIGTVLCHKLGLDIRVATQAQPPAPLLPSQALILPGSSTSFTGDMLALANTCKSALSSLANSVSHVLKVALRHKRTAQPASLPPVTSASDHTASTIAVCRLAGTDSNITRSLDEDIDGPSQRNTSNFHSGIKDANFGSDGTGDSNGSRACGSASSKAGTGHPGSSSKGYTSHSELQSRRKGRQMGPELPSAPSSSGRPAGEGWSDDMLESMLTSVMHVPPSKRKEVFQEVLSVIKHNITHGGMRVSPELVEQVQRMERALRDLPQGGRVSSAEEATAQRLSDVPDAVLLLLLSEHMTVMRSASASTDAKLTALVKVFDAHLNDLLPDYMLCLAQEATVAMFPPTNSSELRALVSSFASNLFAPVLAITDACRLMDKMVLIDGQHAYMAGSILECILDYDLKHANAQEAATELGALFAQEKQKRPRDKEGNRRMRRVEPESSEDEDGGHKGLPSK